MFYFSGCRVFKSGDSFQEGSYDTEEVSGDQPMDEEDEEYTEEGEDYAEEGAEGEEDEEYTEEGEESVADEEGTEKKGGIGAFFSRLFGGSSDEEEDYEEEESRASEEESFEEGEEYAEDYSKEGSEETDGHTDTSEETGVESVSVQEESSSKMAKSGEGVSTTPVTATAEPEKPSIIPLNKIISNSYRKSGHLVNTVYIAREKETLQSISQKIYGLDKVSDLYAINPHLQSRTVKVGDKIYYNSPLRSNDNSRLLFYYEDINAPSSSYSLSPGDNIRSVSSKLLGHPNSWKEIWATNPSLESKGEISKNVNIVYWPKEVVAQAVPSLEPPPEPSSSDDVAMEGDVQKGEGVTQESEAQAVKPPEQFPEPPKTDLKKSQTGLLQMLLKQKEIFLGLIVIIVILIVMLRLILKKRKQRDFDYTATNIEV